MALSDQSFVSFTSRRYSNNCLSGSLGSGYTVPVLAPSQIVLIEKRSPERESASTFFVPRGAACKLGRFGLHLKCSIANCSPTDPTVSAIPLRRISNLILARKIMRAASDNPSMQRASTSLDPEDPSPSTLFRYSFVMGTGAGPVWLSAERWFALPEDRRHSRAT